MLIQHSILTDAPVAAANLAIEGDLALRQEHNFVLPFRSGDESIAWAEIGGQPVGCQVWSGKRVWTLHIGYVRQVFRGQGVIAQIREYVRILARADSQCQSIEFLVTTDNKAMIASLDRAGMKPANYHYRWAAK
jgi:RimJ/RimL family protein N-acetyltransferase